MVKEAHFFLRHKSACCPFFFPLCAHTDRKVIIIRLDGIIQKMTTSFTLSAIENMVLGNLGQIATCRKYNNIHI